MLFRSPVGVCENLTNKDYITSTHRGHGHCIAKGVDVIGMMKELYGKADGVCKGKGGSMHVADMDVGMLGANGIVGGGPPLATGAALAAKLDGKGGVAVSFSGDGSCNQGPVFEAMNIAAILKLPSVYVYENNRYSEHTHCSYVIASESIASRVEVLWEKSIEKVSLEPSKSLIWNCFFSQIGRASCRERV